MRIRGKLRLSALLSTAIALPAFAYVYPLSPTAIREAYFLGTGPKGTEGDLYASYNHNLGIPEKAPPSSFVTIDTPYLQIAEHSRSTPNYHPQDAENDFFNKAMLFRVYADVYYRPKHSNASEAKEMSRVSGASQHIVVKLIQHQKEITTRVVDRQELNTYQDAATSEGSPGEHVELECSAEKIDDSILTIEVSTPDGEHAETAFDLAEIE